MSEFHNNLVSDECLHRITIIKKLIDMVHSLNEETKILYERVNAAEFLLSKVKESVSVEIKHAYDAGIKEGMNISSSQSGTTDNPTGNDTGQTDNDEKKLELKN